MGTIREVRKRDDRVVPFDETKIADAIYKATRAVGRGDRSLAQELASAVTHFLEKKFPGAIPGIEDIQDQVETILIETGHAEIAKAYILYRKKRAAIREILQVRKAMPEDIEGAASAGARLVEDRGGVAPWSKSKISAALIREADLETGAAEEIASAVERKVFASGMRKLSTSLIRELVDNELFERGFSLKLRKQAPLGLPKYNLEQIIFGTDTKEGFSFQKTPAEVQNLIATQILQQYALQEVFSPAVADAHREGRLHIHGLGSPISFHRLTWYLRPPRAARDPALHVLGDPLPSLEGDAEDYLDLSDLFRRLGHLARFVAEEIVLRRPQRLLEGALRSEDETALIQVVQARLQELGSSLSVAAFEAGRAALCIDMDLDRASIPWLQALAGRDSLQGLSLHLRFGAETFADSALRPALETAVALYARGETIEFLPLVPSKGEEPEKGLRPATAPTTINLPRAAFRSAADRRGNIEREIEEVLEIAIRGHLERRRFLERLSASRENPLWDLLGRPSDRRSRPLVDLKEVESPIGIVGLNECVKFLTGREFHQDPQAGRVGLEIVQVMARKLERDSRSLGLRLLLCESRNEGEVLRLEEIDHRRYSELSEIDRGRSGAGKRQGWPEGARYSDGVRMHRSAPVDPLGRISHQAGFLPWVAPTGMIEDSPELRSGGGDLVLSLLEESVPYLCQGAH